MARSPRSPVSRLIVAGVVLLVIVVSVVSFKKRHGAAADQSKVPPADKPNALATKPAVARVPFLTQTPGRPTTRGNAAADNGPPTGESTSSHEPVAPAPAGDAAAVLADAKAKVAAGDLLAARKVLNDALLAGNLSAADDVAVKREMADAVSAVVVFSPRPFPTDPLGGVYPVERGDKLQKIANTYFVTYPLLMDLNRMTDAGRLRADQKLKVVRGPFHAVVTKSTFTIDLYFGAPGGPGSTYVTTFPVGIGADATPTPAGTWLINTKTANPPYNPTPGHPGPARKGGDPLNPIGPFWLALQGVGGDAVGATSFGIHGTIDPPSIGKKASDGCIRLLNDDVATVYKMLIAGKSQVVTRE